MVKLGDRGDAVRDLQLQLKALGYDQGDIDGVFGPRTQTSLEAFQSDQESLEVDGVLGPETAGALAQALVIKQHETPEDAALPDPPTPCDPDTWKAFRALVDQIVSAPVRYGPGRGLFHDGGWVITQGPGALNSKSWTSFAGTTYPSFHCSSFTNFFLGWLLRYNERYTHAGNIPSLFAICEQSDDVHENPGAGPYRGYGPYCRAVVSDGSTYKRKLFPKPFDLHVVDMQELYDRRAQLPTFLVCGESTWKNGSWNMWHHTLLFAIDHNAPDHPMYRIAADGYHAKDHRWSADPMRWVSIDPTNVKVYEANIIFRAYGVLCTADGKYGGDQPIAPVTLET
jgi:Putative peptidoglycan binding domain